MTKNETNSKHEIRNSKQSQMIDIQNSKHGNYYFGNLIFEFWICFEFRYSNLEFVQSGLYRVNSITTLSYYRD
jgi:hypothetical protein